MHLVATFLLFLLLTVPVRASEHKPTHCDDPAVWTDWHEKATRKPALSIFTRCTRWGRGCV